MMGKATVNLQDSFLNQVRKENSEIEMVLVNGTHLTGLVRGFDNFTVVINAGGKQHLVYKHAIAQIVSQRPVQDFAGAPQQAQAQGQPPREQREQREPREQRERRPQPPRPAEQHPQRPADAAPEQRPQQPQRPGKPEQQQHQQRDKFNVLDFGEIKIDQEKS